jgi:hypothetical protein
VRDQAAAPNLLLAAVCGVARAELPQPTEWPQSPGSGVGVRGLWQRGKTRRGVACVRVRVRVRACGLAACCEL